MKCFSRSTLGVVIGVLNILAYIIIAVYVTIGIINAKNLENDPNISHADASKINGLIAHGYTSYVVILVGSVVMTILSILMILGIVKRRHLLMAPWLIINVIGLVGSCIHIGMGIFGIIIYNVELGLVFFLLLVALVLLGIQAFILYKIYALYKDIRAKNKESSKSSNMLY